MDDNEDPSPSDDLVDTDGDNLLDDYEIAIGFDPYAADGDGDGLDDSEELAARTDPRLADTDDDGLLDPDELSAGTDPNDPDSDDDDVLDGDEVDVWHTDPLNTDTDGDEWEDGEEIALGTDPSDASDYPDGRVGDDLECTTATTVTGRTLYDAADDAGLGTDDREALYTDWDDSADEGTECTCTFAVSDSTPRELYGVSVWLPTRAHEGTQWETTPEPAALALELPAGWTDSGDIRLMRSIEFDEVYDGTDLVEHWFGFDDVPTSPDERWSLHEPAPIDPSGIYTLWVSYANTDGEEMENCGVLSGDGPSGDRLKFRVDPKDSSYAAAARPAPEPLACVAGASGTTRFALTNLGLGVRAVPLSGASFVGAGARALRVTDWRGADRLEVRRTGGLVAVLTPERPSVQLDRALPLAEARWFASRSTPGGWSDPVVDVQHACPAGPAAPLPSDVVTLPWRDLDAAVRVATGGLGLELWQPGLGTSTLSALRVSVERGAPGRPDHLVLAPAGGGRLEALLLNRVAEGRWTFRHRQAGVELEGTVQRSGTSLTLTLTRGSVAVGGVTRALSPASLRMNGVVAR